MSPNRGHDGVQFPAFKASEGHAQVLAVHDKAESAFVHIQDYKELIWYYECFIWLQKCWVCRSCCVLCIVVQFITT